MQRVQTTYWVACVWLSTFDLLVSTTAPLPSPPTPLPSPSLLQAAGPSGVGETAIVPYEGGPGEASASHRPAAAKGKGKLKGKAVDQDEVRNHLKNIACSLSGASSRDGCFSRTPWFHGF